MTILLLSGPAVEPLSLAEAKSWLRVTDDAEDQLIQALIASARLAVEKATNRLLISQQWRLTLDALPVSGVLDLPIMPVRAVSRIGVMDAVGVWRNVDVATYSLDAGDDRARILFNAAPPSPAFAKGGVQVDLVAGYGDAPGAVPEPLRLAMRHLVAFWFANRGDDEAAPAKLPAQVAALLAPYRAWRLA